MAGHDIDDVLARLDGVIDRAVTDGDACGYFAVLYRKVTAKVKEGIGNGFFDDAERMERLDVLFAERYLRAVAAHHAGTPPPSSWRLTFTAGGRWRPLVLQHLLAGINAHINLDLGIAAARCAPGGRLPSLRHDYERVNAALAAMIVSVQRDLVTVSPWMGLLNRIGGRAQTELVRFSIVTARDGAWEFATDLAATPEPGWAAAIEARDHRVARIGRLVLHPGPLTSAKLLLVRLRERDDVAANLRLLLDAEEPSLATIDAGVAEPSLTP